MLSACCILLSSFCSFFSFLLDARSFPSLSLHLSLLSLVTILCVYFQCFFFKYGDNTLNVASSRESYLVVKLSGDVLEIKSLSKFQLKLLFVGKRKLLHWKCNKNEMPLSLTRPNKVLK